MDACLCQVEVEDEQSHDAEDEKGSDKNVSAKIVPARSRTVRGCTADMIPIGIPMISQRMTAPRTRDAVTGSAREISLLTGTWFW